LLSPRRAALVALAAIAFACAVLMQPSGPNQAAHFALVRALADGTAEIDPRETIDAAYVDGRFYAAKAPGLAMFTLPWYGLLRSVGLQDTSPATEAGYTRRLWELNLFGAVLPAIALLVLVFLAVERIVPGLGLPTSVLLGAGTLLFPFATLFFDHALSATLGFAAFVLLLLSGRGHRGTLAVGAAGLLAGLAMVAEFPLALVALVLAPYSAWSGSLSLRRAASYATGVLVGVVPLLAYNTWAFGSPTTLSYTNALEAPVGSGSPLVGANEEGFYGVGLPDPRTALSLLFSEKGLAVVAPLAVVALAGLPLLWRAGHRAEALVCGAVPALFLVYNAAYYLPWGGQGPGPRFLMPALPFIALPLAAILRAQPVAVAAVGLASVGVMALATVTDPLTGSEYGIATWWDALWRAELVDTVLTRVGVDSVWLAVAPFLALLVLALALALASLPVRGPGGVGWSALASVLGAWALLAVVAPRLLPADEENGTLAGTLALLLLLCLLGAGAFLARRVGVSGLLIALPTLVLVLPVFEDRPRLTLLLVALLTGATGLVVAIALGRRRAGQGSPAVARRIPSG
jgi:hypothetical protein